MKTEKPVIEVHHWGGDAPAVKLPKGLEAKIVYIDDQAEDTRILAYKGIAVYRTFNDYDVQSDYWVSTCPGENIDSEHAFDLRDLPKYPEHKAGHYERLGLENDRSGGNAFEISCLMYCIDQGWLTEEGLTLPKEAK